MNSITVVGNITRDFELRFGEGYAVANGGLAVNKSWKGKDGEWKESTSFMNLSVWNQQFAENVVTSLPKGTRVLVTGELSIRSYEDDDGNKRSAHEIKLKHIGPDLTWAAAHVTKNPKGEYSKSDSNAVGSTVEPAF